MPRIRRYRDERMEFSRLVVDVTLLLVACSGGNVSGHSPVHAGGREPQTGRS
jgi:hypothetical protein